MYPLAETPLILGTGVILTTSGSAAFITVLFGFLNDTETSFVSSLSPGLLRFSCVPFGIPVSIPISLNVSESLPSEFFVFSNVTVLVVSLSNLKSTFIPVRSRFSPLTYSFFGDSVIISSLTFGIGLTVSVRVAVFLLGTWVIFTAFVFASTLVLPSGFGLGFIDIEFELKSLGSSFLVEPLSYCIETSSPVRSSESPTVYTRFSADGYFVISIPVTFRFGFTGSPPLSRSPPGVVFPVDPPGILFPFEVVP